MSAAGIPLVSFYFQDKAQLFPSHLFTKKKRKEKSGWSYSEEKKSSITDPGLTLCCMCYTDSFMNTYRTHTLLLWLIFSIDTNLEHKHMSRTSKTGCVDVWMLSVWRGADKWSVGDIPSDPALHGVDICWGGTFSPTSSSFSAAAAAAVDVFYLIWPLPPGLNATCHSMRKHTWKLKQTKLKQISAHTELTQCISWIETWYLWSNVVIMFYKMFPITFQSIIRPWGNFFKLYTNIWTHTYFDQSSLCPHKTHFWLQFKNSHTN